MKHIILLGSERSGSNLLRTLLGKHSHIAAPPPCHFTDAFLPALHRFGNLQEKDHATTLLKAMVVLANSSFSQWNLQAEAAAIQEKYQVDCFYKAFAAIYSEFAQQSGKPGFFCKDNHMHLHAHALLHHNPATLFIYLYRDPRDQVASWMRRPLLLHSPLLAANKWKKEQLAISALSRGWGLPLIPVPYEALVSSPAEVMGRVLEALSLPIEERCFTTDPANKESQGNVYWENLRKPIMKDNFGKYHDILSGIDIQMIEDACADVMQTLGYSTEFKERKFLYRKLRGKLYERWIRTRNQFKAHRLRKRGHHDPFLNKKKLLAEITRLER